MIGEVFQSRSDSTILGIDVGGANLKYATAAGEARSVAFPLWLQPQMLAARLGEDIASFPAARRLAVTMTGELADCFLDREAGVRAIVAACVEAARHTGGDAPRFYAVDGQFHDAESACRQVDLIAAANWHALATHVAEQLEGSGIQRALLIDIGSTTTDLVPIVDGRVGSKAQTDFDRLKEGSLAYLGGERTPLCAIVDGLVHRGVRIPIMREVFATMADVRLLLGHTAPLPDDRTTADGKPRDSFHAANRMARMIGLDHRHLSADDAMDLARQVHRQAVAEIDAAIERCRSNGLIAGDEPWVISGHAADLLPARRSGAATIRLGEVLGDPVARCAPAYAVARLFDALAET